MSITNKRREALVDYLTKELGISHVRDFSESMRKLNICDLLDDKDLIRVTETGAIDSLVVSYRMGVVSKLIEVQKIIKED